MNFSSLHTDFRSDLIILILIQQSIETKELTLSVFSPLVYPIFKIKEIEFTD